MTLGFDSIFGLVIVPLLIFLARVLDVSLGTIRVIFIAKGFRFLAPLLGFFEVLIWLGAVRYIFLNLTNVVYYLAYAGGFAAGTFVGIYLEDKISIGKVLVRIITKKDSLKLLKALKKEGCTVISNGAKSPNGNVKNIFTVIKRQDISKVIELVKKLNPDSFYSISDVRFATENHNYHSTDRKRHILKLFDFHRKRK